MKDSREMRLEEVARAIIEARCLEAGRDPPRCDCGWPFDDTPDHAPGCPWGDALEEAMREAAILEALKPA